MQPQWPPEVLVISCGQKKCQISRWLPLRDDAASSPVHAGSSPLASCPYPCQQQGGTPSGRSWQQMCQRKPSRLGNVSRVAHRMPALRQLSIMALYPHSRNTPPLHPDFYSSAARFKAAPGPRTHRCPSCPPPGRSRRGRCCPAHPPRGQLYCRLTWSLAEGPSISSFF